MNNNIINYIIFVESQSLHWQGGLGYHSVGDRGDYTLQ